MSKNIKVQEETYEKLTKIGRWEETMDDIINRLVKTQEGCKTQ